MTNTTNCVSTEFSTVPIRLPIRLYMLATGISQSEALNCERVHDVALNADIGSRLKSTMNQLKADGLDIETGKVDYRTLEASPSFQQFRQLVSHLQHFDLNSLSIDSERKAFWINLFNVLMIHGVIAYGAKHSVLEIRGTFERVAYIIGGLRFSLDDIEHGILRANRAHAVIPGVRFKGHDPRRQFIINRFDPRIHFALVCAANSCPPIGIYTADELDLQLDLATKHFINHGGVVLNKEKMTVSLSRIFQWYSSDFGGSWMGFGNKTPVLQFISHYLLDESDVRFVADHMEDMNVTYQKYDWSLNV